MSSGDDEIKSALDIAMEKAQRLGSLSSEESRRLKEDELAKAGEALAKRYQGGLPLRDIEAQLGKSKEEDRAAVVRYMLAILVDAIDIKQVEGSEKVLVAVQHFSGDPDAVQRIGDLFHEYQEAGEKARQQNLGALEVAKRKELESRGISGSAVQSAAETSLEWLQIQHRLDSQYQERLSELKAPWIKPPG
ncbi:MAG: hypothetical protein V3S51_04735 [Dehalococcoidia bacterium]